LRREASGLQPRETGLAIAAEVALDEHGEPFAANGLVMRATVALPRSGTATPPNFAEMLGSVTRKGLLAAALSVDAGVLRGKWHGE
jgi:hypothetical protein